MSAPLQRNAQLTPSNSAPRRRNNNAWNPSGLLLRPRPTDIVLRPSDNVSKPNGSVPKPRLRQRKVLRNVKAHRLKSSEPSKRLNRPDWNRSASVSSLQKSSTEFWRLERP